MEKYIDEIYAYALENSINHGKAIESAVLPKLFRHGLKKEEIKDILPRIKIIVDEINSWKEEAKIEKYEEYKQFLKEKTPQREGLKDLPNVRGKPIFRVAPFPSGAIHIGNSRTFLLNAMYAEKYNGKVILVIDDTIGSDEKSIMPEAYEMIPESLKYLKIKYKKPVIYKSDRLEIYYEYAEKLIKKDKAYVCGCPQETLRDNRLKQLECSCRQFPVEMQLERWKKMFESPQGSYTLRIKTSMTHPNPAFRDRVLFRISDKEHPRTKKKYRVWPLLEFSWAIDDHLLKITHIVRGKDLMIEGDMEKYIWDIFGWKHVEIIHNGLMQLGGVEGKIGKSKAQKEVKSGEYIGWNDPRTWSILSLKDRGILTESIREFIKNIGITQKDIEVPIDDLYAINRRNIDKDADRYSFVENPVQIKNNSKIKSIRVKIHPEKENEKIINISKSLFIPLSDFNKFKDKEVRLMHLSNIILNEDGKLSESQSIKNIPKINWVSKSIETKILMPNGVWKTGLAEQKVKSLKKGQIIQFERFGFCKFHRFDKKKKECEFWFTHD